MTIPASPDFRSPAFLRQHVSWVMDFYSGRAIDPSGGFHHFLKDDGTVFDAHTRHLVSSARYVFLWAMAAHHFPDTPAYLDNALGIHESAGRLPIGLPISMEAIEGSFEDVPKDVESYTDSAGNTYEFGFGLSCSGEAIK